MSHEILEHDNIVLHREPAWHGLGIVVEDAPTPRAALTLAGIDWGVDQYEMFHKNREGKEVKVGSHVMNIRADKEIELGVVSSGYRIIQNADMADFCEAIGASGKVRCESVASLYNGARVFFLLKGEAFEIGKKKDVTYPYLCVSNGHDGGAAFRVNPTSVRVVCRNTLHMVIPSHETGELGMSAVCFRHTANIMERIEQTKFALARYGEAVATTKEIGNTLAAKDVKKEDLERFFLESYTAEYYPEEGIPANPKDAKEERRRNKALSAYGSFSRRFDDEVKTAGANMWTAFNAFSGMVQHDAKARGKDDAARVAYRVEQNLFGLAQDRTMNVLKRALAYAAG